MTITSQATTLFVWFTLVLSSCSTERPDGRLLFRSALREDLLGCYALFTERGRRLDTSFYNASPLVRLDSAPLFATDRGGPPGVVRVMVRLDSTGHPMDPVNPRYHLGPSWLVDSITDTLRLSFSNGFSGAALKLTAAAGSGDTLRGQIEEHWDFGPPFTTRRGKGRAVRIQCTPT